MLPAHNQAFLLLCLFCLGVMVAGITAPINAAEVYRWKDDSGKIVYGDKPPNDKPSTPVTVKNTENTGAQFATTGQVKKLERDAQKGRRATRSPPPRTDGHCRSYVSQLNRVEIFLEHTNTPRDQLKARDLRKLIKKECSRKLLTQKFDDSQCKRYRKSLTKTEIFLEHTPSPRDEFKARDLRIQIARECR
ncbi:MAG: DUF4124 domain-containing protein [Ectothiorhodospiraceae bacterium]|nr:DUF4124 domain-containing protein [Ectothiorhodospiraceae bacterium]